MKVCKVEGCLRRCHGQGYCRNHYITTTPCKVEGCIRSALARGLCKLHYNRWCAGRDLTIPIRPRISGEKPATCTVENCARPYWASGYCSQHYHALHPSGQNNTRKIDRARKQKSKFEADNCADHKSLNQKSKFEADNCATSAEPFLKVLSDILL